MKIDLTGKTALVTASTAGIGFATAKGLAECGASVVINGRSDPSVASALDKLRTAMPAAALHGIAADLGDAVGANKLLALLPTIDILVNNAGLFEARRLEEADDATWERHWQTNVMSGVRLSRALLPRMIERGWGRVVFISSESARNIPVDMIHYGVVKTALLGLARGLAKHAAGSGVTVNSVLPGPTLSDGFAAMLQEEAHRTNRTVQQLADAFVIEQRGTSVIRRASTVEEVASMIIYLCSPQASATTGASLRVDGGVVDDIV